MAEEIPHGGRSNYVPPVTTTFPMAIEVAFFIAIFLLSILLM